MPVSETVRGLPLPLSVIVTVAVRAPIAVGANATLIVQLALAASVAGDTGQVSVCEKSAAFVPVIAMALIVNAPGPLLATVVLCATLVVFFV